MAAHPPLVVLLEGRPMGRITRDDRWRLNLVYDVDYRNADEATPLSVSMPRAQAEHPHSAVEPWLWGLLPDNDRVLDRWGRDFGVTTASPFALLGTPIGHDCAGAVQFAFANEVDELMNRPGDVEWLDEAAVATRLRQLATDSTAWHGTGSTGRFSLGGAQAKIALHWDTDKGWALPSGPVPTSHIIKPAIAGLESHDLNEHLCLTAARNLGLPAARTTIQQFEDQSAIVVERYDRRLVDGDLIRVHQEDMCQAIGRYPGDKYQAEGGPTPSEIATVLRNTIGGPGAERAVWRFADGLIFNWLIAGTDAHAKNYSLRLSGAQTRFAPLYDIASYLPYDDSKGHQLKLAMKVGGDYKLLRTDRRSSWERAARELRIESDALLDRVVLLTTQIADAFTGAANSDEMKTLASPLTNHLVDLVAGRAHSCHQALWRD